MDGEAGVVVVVDGEDGAPVAVVYGMFGCREYGKNGKTATIFFADAALQACIIVSNSMR